MKTDLDFIEAVLAAGSFSGAAERICLTQSAVSQRIGKIERELGTPVFERGTRPIRLTKEGEYFVGVERCIRQLRAERDRYFEDLREGLHGHIRVGSNPCRTSTLLLPTLTAFMETYPDVTIDLVETESADMAEALASGEVDFGLTLSTRVTPEMEHRILARERVFLAVPHGHRLAAKGTQPDSAADPMPTADFADFAGEPFVLIDHGLKFHEQYFALCRRYGVEPKVILEADAMSVVHELVAQGIGCSLVPEEVAYCTRNAPCRPAYFDLAGETAENPVEVVWMRERYLPKAAETFISMLLARPVECMR